MISINWAMAQSEESVKIEIPLQKFMQMDKALQEYPILREMNSEKDKAIVELQNSLTLQKKTNELNEREIDLQKRINDVQKMEIEAQKRAFTDMKEVADRAIKLVEVSKPKSNWELYGLLGMAAFIVGHLITN